MDGSIIIFRSVRFDRRTHYYVSPTGSNGNPGTLSAPLQTIGYAVSLPNPALISLCALVPIAMQSELARQRHGRPSDLVYMPTAARR